MVARNPAPSEYRSPSIPATTACYLPRNQATNRSPPEGGRSLRLQEQADVIDRMKEALRRTTLRKPKTATRIFAGPAKQACATTLPQLSPTERARLAPEPLHLCQCACTGHAVPRRSCRDAASRRSFERLAQIGIPIKKADEKVASATRGSASSRNQLDDQYRGGL